MIFCTNCGHSVNEDDVFCTNCGTPVKKIEVSTTKKAVDYVEIVGKVGESADKVLKNAGEIAGKAAKEASEAADKAAKSAQNLKNTISEQVEQKKAEIQADVESRGRRESEHKRSSTVDLSENDFAGYMSDTELWSWLKKDSKRQQFFTEESNALTSVEFMEKVQNKIDENNVPAKIQRRRIQWDRSSVKQDVFIVKPRTSSVSPISYLLQFNHIGKFTYVEEKSFITPPNLPKVPLKSLPIPSSLAGQVLFLLYGIIMLVLGVLLLVVIPSVGGVLLLIGACLAIFGYTKKTELDALHAHNKKCEEMEKAWNDAWINWENSIFLHSFQEDINGQLSRIYDSVFGCIKQVCSEEFQECSREQEDSSNMNELEQLIARRKDDYR